MDIRPTIEKILASGGVPVMACFRCIRIEACETFEEVEAGWLPEGPTEPFRCECGAGRGWLLCFFCAAGDEPVAAAVKSLREMAEKVNAEAFERATKRGPCSLPAPPLPTGTVQILEGPKIRVVDRVLRSIAFGAGKDQRDLRRALRNIPIKKGLVVNLRPDFYYEVCAEQDSHRCADGTGLGLAALNPRKLLGLELRECDDMPEGVAWIVEER
jgi:hypothetical protein